MHMLSLMRWHSVAIWPIMQVVFTCEAHTVFGQEVRVVGSTKEFGHWNPALAPALKTSPSTYPKWVGTIDCQECNMEFKYVIFDPKDGRVTWENGMNRFFNFNPDYDSRCQVEPLRTRDRQTMEVAPSKGSKLHLWGGAHSIKKAHGKCEDAYFVDPHGMGVADGVGCFAKYANLGVNAAQYAAELMHFSCLALQPEGQASESKFGHNVAERAAGAVAEAESKAVAFGGSTIAVLCQQDNQIGVANLGDSGFMLLRRGLKGMNVIMKSEEQQHYFNCPYQLTHLPTVPRSPSSPFCPSCLGASLFKSSSSKNGTLNIMGCWGT